MTPESEIRNEAVISSKIYKGAYSLTEKIPQK